MNDREAVEGREKNRKGGNKRRKKIQKGGENKDRKEGKRIWRGEGSEGEG